MTSKATALLTAYSPALVFGMCDWLDVLRVHASAVPAEVVRLKASGHRANKVFICPSVSERSPSHPPTNTKYTISPKLGCCPFPTPIIEGTNLLPEAKGESRGKLGEHRELILLVSGSRALTRRGCFRLRSHYITYLTIVLRWRR